VTEPRDFLRDLDGDLDAGSWLPFLPLFALAVLLGMFLIYIEVLR
jgi:hypothetical protein